MSNNGNGKHVSVESAKLPSSVNIFGIEYAIEYCEKPSDVDLYKRRSLWGQIDLWTRTIRVYKNSRPTTDIWQTILHECLHGIVEQLHIGLLQGEERENVIDLLALGMLDLMTRNGWMKGSIDIPAGLPAEKSHCISDAEVA